MAKKNKNKATFKSRRGSMPEDMSSYGNNRFVEEKDKDIDWGIGLMQSIFNRLSGSGSEGDLRQKAQTNYEHYHGIYDDKTIMYLTHQHGERVGVPYTRFPLGRGRIDQVISEFTKIPPKRHCMAVDSDAIDKKENERIMMEVRKITADSDEKIEKEMGSPIDANQNVPLVDNIDQWFADGNYKEIWADQINNGIDYLYKVRNLIERIVPGLRSHLLNNRCFWELRVEDGDPMPIRIDERGAIYEHGNESDYLENPGLFYYDKWCTLGEIIDEFRHSEAFQGQQGRDLIKRLEAYGGISQTPISTSRNWPFGTDAAQWATRDPQTGTVYRVSKLFWQSRRKQAMKISTSKDGKTRAVFVDANQKMKSNEEKIITDADDPWQIVCIAGMEYIEFKRCPNWYKDVDSPGKNPIPVVGMHVGKNTGFTTSMQDLINPIEEMYNEVMFHIRLRLARSGGKALIYDVSQMPKAFAKSVQKVAHHMKNDSIIPVDLSKISDEQSNFNQWKEVDLSLDSGIQNLMQMAAMLENMADDISGVSDQRRGEIGQYETAANAQEAIIRSSTRTEVFLYPFNQVLKRLLERLANMMKATWEEGKSASYWNPNGSQVLLKVLPDIGLHNYGFYIGSNIQDQQIKRKIEALVEGMATNAQDPELLRSFVKIMKADYADEAETIFDKALDIISQQSQQAAQAEQEAKQAEMEAKAAELEAKDKQHKETLENNIDVANINAGSKIMTAEVLTDQVEMVERGKLLSQTKESSEKDSKPDGQAEKKTKEQTSSKPKPGGGADSSKAVQAKQTMASNQAK